jgi:gas vesicle protein
MKSSDFLAGVLVGALIGAALGLLFAPEPGEETRARVKEGALKFKDAAADRGRAFLHRGEEAEGEEEAESD